MSQTFDESNLRFTFDNQWQVLQYDIHPNHVNIKIEHQKAIDFLALFNGEKILLFEMKSFKNHRIEAKNAGRTTNHADDLTTEIAQKIRDSLAGIIGAGRNPNSKDYPFWKKIAKKLTNAETEFYIIAWIEEDKPKGYHQLKAKVKATTKNDKLKAKLRWLNAKISICDIDDTKNFDGLTVIRLPQKKAA